MFFKIYFTSNAVVFIERTFCKKFDIVPSVVVIGRFSPFHRPRRPLGGVQV